MKIGLVRAIHAPICVSTDQCVQGMPVVVSSPCTNVLLCAVPQDLEKALTKRELVAVKGRATAARAKAAAGPR